MPRSTTRKQRRTYTLSSEAIAILDAEKRDRRKSSASSTLEELLKERKRQKEMEAAAISISRYYDSLSEEEIAEQQVWGKFSESQFSN